MVKVSFDKKDGQIYKFVVDNTDTLMLNVLRRTVNYYLNIYAVEEIDFYDNDSVIVDEMLANRIGLCPISNPLDVTGKKVTLSLKKEGPCTVYSGDFISSDSDIKPVYDNIPLTKLEEGQRVRLDAYALQGQGTNHVKYSPAIVSYYAMADLEVLKGCDGCEKCLEACPKDCLKIVSKKPQFKDQSLCDDCRACVDACPQKCLKLNDSDKYILNIELIGQSPIDILVKKLERYSKEYFMLLKKKFK